MSNSSTFIGRNANITRAALREVGILSGAPRQDTRDYNATVFDRRFPYVRNVNFPIGCKYTLFTYTVVMKSTKPATFKLSFVEYNETDASETVLVVIEDITCENPKTFYLHWSGKTCDSSKSYRLIFETTTCHATTCIIRDYTSVVQFNSPPDPDEIPQRICPL